MVAPAAFEAWVSGAVTFELEARGAVTFELEARGWEVFDGAAGALDLEVEAWDFVAAGRLD